LSTKEALREDDSQSWVPGKIRESGGFEATSVKQLMNGESSGSTDEDDLTCARRGESEVESSGVASMEQMEQLLPPDCLGPLL